jgi:putative sigma-54 modulation protein
MQINIKATNMELTDAIRQYVQEKMDGVVKFFNRITDIDIDVGMESHHHNKGKVYYAEANVSVPGKLIRVRKNATNLYKAIDKVKDHLKVELQGMKEKRRGRDKEELRNVKGYEL